MEFIGVILDWTMAKALLPQTGFFAVQSLILNVKVYPLTMLRNCLRLLKHEAACTYVVRYAR